jgi:hypothetical protein
MAFQRVLFSRLGESLRFLDCDIAFEPARSGYDDDDYDERLDFANGKKSWRRSGYRAKGL